MMAEGINQLKAALGFLLPYPEKTNLYLLSTRIFS